MVSPVRADKLLDQLNEDDGTSIALHHSAAADPSRAAAPGHAMDSLVHSRPHGRRSSISLLENSSENAAIAQELHKLRQLHDQVASSSSTPLPVDQQQQKPRGPRPQITVQLPTEHEEGGPATISGPASPASSLSPSAHGTGQRRRSSLVITGYYRERHEGFTYHSLDNLPQRLQGEIRHTREAMMMADQQAHGASGNAAINLPRRHEHTPGEQAGTPGSSTPTKAHQANLIWDIEQIVELRSPKGHSPCQGNLHSRVSPAVLERLPRLQQLSAGGAQPAGMGTATSRGPSASGGSNTTSPRPSSSCQLQQRHSIPLAQQVDSLTDFLKDRPQERVGSHTASLRPSPSPSPPPSCSQLSPSRQGMTAVHSWNSLELAAGDLNSIMGCGAAVNMSPCRLQTPDQETVDEDNGQRKFMAELNTTFKQWAF